MTIHRTLLISYLLISLISALLLALLIFSHFRSVLKQEIANKLESQATTTIQQIDATLFERIQNIDSWSNLAIMQEIRTRDVDKRLSLFLSELHKEYAGVYQELYVVNRDNQIIASSDAKKIGKVKHRQVAPWYKETFSGILIGFETLVDNSLTIKAAINDTFQTGQLGGLFARLNWLEMTNLLNESLATNALDDPFYALLLDDSNRVISFTSNLQEYLHRFQILDHHFVSRINTGFSTVYVPFLQQNSLVGQATSKGYRKFPGLGWRLLIIQPEVLAFAPVLKVWHVVLVFLCIVCFISFVISLWISARIANPIKNLEKTTRLFMEGMPPKQLNLRTSSEIKSLNNTFFEMMTNLEKSRQDVERIAKLAVMGEMAACMAHEVRTPLGILRSSAQILKRDRHLSDIGKEMTDYIICETTRLNELINTLLECAKPRPPKFARHSMESIMIHVLELLRSQADQKQISISFHSDQPVDARCDRDFLIQAFLNLVMNAIQHVDNGGTIQITIQNRNTRLQVSICDDGPGINQTDKLKVFDPFFTQRVEGIGLGLTVVQQVVLAHNGEITITDNQPKGTCFKLFFPLSI